MAQPRTYPEGVTSWVDTEQGDLDAALDFYGGLFGWTFSEATPSGVPFRYVIAQRDGLDVCGLGGPSTAPVGVPAGGPARWHTYVAVGDADAMAERVEQLGGALVQLPTPAGEGGRSVVVRDPQGLELRLWEARRRLGAQVANVPGAWNFSDLQTDEPEVTRRFYEQAFGWVFADVGFATMIQVPGYGDHLAATLDPEIRERQADAGAPPGFADAIGWVVPVAPGDEPGWHVTFTVADRDEAADRVVRLGGSVVRTGDSDWTRTVVVRDPQGAVFTASQFLG